MAPKSSKGSRAQPARGHSGCEEPPRGRSLTVQKRPAAATQEGGLGLWYHGPSVAAAAGAFVLVNSTKMLPDELLLETLREYAHSNGGLVLVRSGRLSHRGGDVKFLDSVGTAKMVVPRGLDPNCWRWSAVISTVWWLERALQRILRKVSAYVLARHIQLDGVGPYCVPNVKGKFNKARKKDKAFQKGAKDSATVCLPSERGHSE